MNHADRYEPTPEEIEEACQQIHQTWSEVTRQSRRQGPSYEDVHPPVTDPVRRTVRRPERSDRG